MKFKTSINIIILIIVVAAEDCDKCVYKEECPAFVQLNQTTQDLFRITFPCSAYQNTELNDSNGIPNNQRDFVCCSGAVLNKIDMLNPGVKKNSNTTENNNNHNDQNSHDEWNRNTENNNITTRPPNSFIKSITNNAGSDSDGLRNNRYNTISRKGNNMYNPENPTYGTPNTMSPINGFYGNNKIYERSSRLLSANGPDNTGIVNQVEQCPTQSFPPEPATGCCGREATDADRIIGHQPQQMSSTALTKNGKYPWGLNPPNYRGPINSRTMSWATPTFYNFNINLNRTRRQVENNVHVTIDDRIAGGQETELEQFPWTVLLIVTFDYGNKRMSFDCGGSLISSKYVLTAGHCVYDKGRRVLNLDMYLAEYDKRTFPKDCKIVVGQGQKCIENMIIKADGIILHPQFEDSHLQNDIALIRLRDNAPYTYYIRPICLPTIDIDSPEFINLRLAVAGWGRNGRYRSDIKQSTFINLVPQQKCIKYYPELTKRNLCAVGYSGEDTCKGDSGGPLMTVYGGKYEVVGIVSGKRSDVPCGASVPSLYTNVYHYLDWIRNNIRN